jgi:hypothetical protein
MSSKEKAILDRIKHLEDAIAKGREFLKTGKAGDWHGFRPLFVGWSPPHKDWVKNVFLPRHEKLLIRAHKALERLTLVGKNRRTLKGVLLRSAPQRGRKTALIKWRAEPANTPLVEQATYGTCDCGTGLEGTKQHAFDVGK